MHHQEGAIEVIHLTQGPMQCWGAALAMAAGKPSIYEEYVSLTSSTPRGSDGWHDAFISWTRSHAPWALPALAYLPKEYPYPEIQPRLRGRGVLVIAQMFVLHSVAFEDGIIHDPSPTFSGYRHGLSYRQWIRSRGCWATTIPIGEARYRRR